MRPSCIAPRGSASGRGPATTRIVEPDVVMACCGDVPTLETLAAVSILREHLPELKIRVVNVVDLMKLQPHSEHPHGLSDIDFDALFTKDKPVIFAFHGYPWLIHRLTYRRTNRNLHVRGYKEEGTITTAFDMTSAERYGSVSFGAGRDRSSAALGCRGRLSEATDGGQTHRAQALYRRARPDLPEIRNWKWIDRSGIHAGPKSVGTQSRRQETNARQ